MRGVAAAVHDFPGAYLAAVWRKCASCFRAAYNHYQTSRFNIPWRPTGRHAHFTESKHHGR
ncbi:MAG: hypothetical protein JWR22_3080 [Herminiimonas sp.]|nr:hypothetical protein [Herminiimonas sp.]